MLRAGKCEFASIFALASEVRGAKFDKGSLKGILLGRHMKLNITNIFLADDDEDDQFMFQEALQEIVASTNLVTANDGEQLMETLHNLKGNLPDVHFLDLNMPRKNGFQCLREIRLNEKFSSLPTIIFSTSYEPDVIERLYKSGADHYIKKPTEFNELKKIIERVLKIVETPYAKPSIDRFVIR
jgi:CheY-like chemotaxis protein